LREFDKKTPERFRQKLEWFRGASPGRGYRLDAR
jgi:hypothetical protein